VASKTLWISTAKGPDLLREAAKRLAVDPSKFDFLDFPRAFQKDIARYILDHVSSYRAVVIDSIEGVAGRQNIDVVTHSVLYQVAKEKPVILVAEEETPRIAYVADHVIHMVQNKQPRPHSKIHTAREIKNTPTKPPLPLRHNRGSRYNVHIPPPDERKRRSNRRREIRHHAPRRSTICIHSEKVKNVADLLSKIKDRSIFLQVSYFTSLD